MSRCESSPESDQIKTMYIDLAAKAIESYVTNGEVMDLPEDCPKDFYEERKGVFVSIKKEGELRGCIGTYIPTEENLGKEIITNAIKAATGDPRFPPITEEELDKLEISVDILSKPAKCSREDLDPKRYGILVEKGGRKGLLLPDLEGVDTVNDQLDIAKRKAGISPQEEVEIYRFRVERHKKT